VREAPPPYAGVGPHALWHVSEDVERFLGGERARRVHVVEPAWLERMHTQRVVAYRIPEQTFVENIDRFWISAQPVVPLELVERHEAAAIELRTEPDLLGSWDEVIESSLGFSGIRLRNARMHA
jgi:hypothetical protein